MLDDGAFLARMFNYKGAAFAPDFDMGLSDWAGYGDPGETLTSFTAAADRRHQRAGLVERRPSTS